MINMLKKIFVILILLIGMPIFAETIKAGVSKIGSVPNSFFGSWRVVAKLDKQSGSAYFKPQAVEICKKFAKSDRLFSLSERKLWT